MKKKTFFLVDSLLSRSCFSDFEDSNLSFFSFLDPPDEASSGSSFFLNGFGIDWLRLAVRDRVR